MRRLGNIALYAAGIILALAGLGIGLFSYMVTSAPFKGLTFEPAAWQAADAGGVPCIRCEMAEDLRDNHLPGTRTEVHALLGPPRAEGLIRAGYTACDDYNLTEQSGSVWWDAASLYVCYAEDGRVAHSLIQTR